MENNINKCSRVRNPAGMREGTARILSHSHTLILIAAEVQMKRTIRLHRYTCGAYSARHLNREEEKKSVRSVQ